MDCEEVKRVIPKYFNHTATEDEIKIVEEHLCTCHDCRSTLGELMDKLAIPDESEAKETTEASESVENQEMEYIPGKGAAGETNESQETPQVEPEQEPAAEISPAPAEKLEEPQPEPEPEPEPKKEEDALGAVEEKEQLAEAGEFSLDDVPLSKGKAGIFEYAALIVGVVIFGALLYLLLKG